jgi:PPOX class probable F420-dependent enzyme
MALTDEKYIATSTYRKSGDAVTTATWIVPLEGGRFGFWTSSVSGKAKRLRNNPRVTVQPSDARGRVKAGTSAVEGTVALFTSGPEFDEVQAKVRKKYGFGVPMSKFFGMIGHIGKGKFPYGDVVVVVTPDSSPTG